MGNVTAKTSGEIASFMTPAETNIKSLKVHFSPKQLGTGDPSPENVREIVGWDGVEVNGCGKNLFGGEAFASAVFPSLLKEDEYGKYIRLHNITNAESIFTMPFKENTQYTFIGKIRRSATASTSEIRIKYTDNTWSQLFASTTNKDEIRILKTTSLKNKTIEGLYYLQRTINFDIYYNDFGIFEGDIPIESFKPYQGNTISYQWKLPDEYQEVEYIESTGTQYLLTDLIFRKDLENPRIEWKHMQIAEPVNDTMLFGYTATGGSVYFEYYAITGRGYSGIGGIRYQNIHYPSSLGLNKIAICSMDKEKLILNGTEFSPNGVYTNLTSVNPISIFAWTNSNGTSGDYINKGARIYYLRFYNGDKLLGNFVPCYRKSDNEIGMYDTVSQTFYTNQGTGTFLKGDDVDKTFYGGYIDLVSGELVKEWGMFTVDEPDSRWRVAAYNRITINFPRKYIFGSRLLKDKSMCTILPENHTDWNYGYIDNVASVTNPHALSLNYTGNGGGWSELFGEEATNENVKEHLQEIGFAICATLATPITHQLTSTQLSSFIGQNNFWSNADYVEIEYDLIETIDIQKAKQKIILNQPQLKTISNKVVSFNTDMVAPMKNCKIYFKLIQLGTGDPSPTNVRNINGWTSIDSYVNGDKISVDWTNDAGTIYGGYLDLAKGEVVAEYNIVDLGTLTCAVEYDEAKTYSLILPSATTYQEKDEPSNLYCSSLTPLETVKTIGLIRSMGFNNIAKRAQNTSRLYVRSELDTADAVKTSLAGYIVAYKLATPIHYPLSSFSQQLLTAKSTNHIWSDTNGQLIEAKYWTHKNINPVPLTDYLENQTWTDSAYISSSGKKTTGGTSASHFLTNQILLEAGTYVLSGFSYYVGTDNTNFRIHAYDSSGKWVKQITFQQIGNLSPVDISFTLDTDTYVNVSIAMDFDGVLAKIN